VRVSRVLGVLGLSAALFAVGYGGARSLGRGARPAAGVARRPAVLEAAHRAHERGDRVALAEQVAALDAAPPADPRHAAEAALLSALSRGDREALRRLAEERPDVAAGARALWILASKAEDSPERANYLVEVFAARWPRAWVLAERR
jgi:hypothetical protein